MNGLELYDRLRLLRDAAADNAYMMGDERERGMYDGYGEVMRRCLELPEADVEDWIYGFTHAIWELDGLAGTWGRRTPDGRMEATIADGAIEVIRVSGDSREVRWRGVYEAKGRKWVVREAPKESHTANTAYHDPLTDIIIFSAIL